MTKQSEDNKMWFKMTNQKVTQVGEMLEVRCSRENEEKVTEEVFFCNLEIFSSFKNR